MLVLGIESSCDETAAALVEDGRVVWANVVYSQIKEHRAYGGVVPEIAARRHLEVFPQVLRSAVEEGGVRWRDLDLIAVTTGPGLASSLLVGVSTAKALALRLEKPLCAVNHLEAHLISLLLDPEVPEPEVLFPALILLVTGGNTCLVHMQAVGHYRLLGQTLDDAAGEALDKGASLLGLGYPGGPALEKEADGGNGTEIRFPRGLEHPRGGEWIHGMDRSFCFSFSGVKTSLRYHLEKYPEDRELPRRRDTAASYQAAVFDALLMRVKRALKRIPVKTLGVVGGVARNRRLRTTLEEAARERGVALCFAPPAYCTDNAAMIAGLAGLDPVTAAPVDVASLDIQPALKLRVVT